MTILYDQADPNLLTRLPPMPGNRKRRAQGG